MAPKDQTSRSARIEVFRPGTFTPMHGGALSFTGADLKSVADNYDPDTAPAPIVVGHPATDAPAFGWATAFEYDATSERLFAEVSEIDATFSEAVEAGRYKKVSLSFFPPEHSANPVPGTWYPKHIGFLGGAAPAVSGLKNVQFSIPQHEATTITADFGEFGFEQTARMFQGLREWIISKWGKEAADEALPGYEIEWLDDTEIQNKGRSFKAPDPTPQPKPKPKKEAPVVDPNNSGGAGDEAAFAARAAELDAREAQLNHDDNASFAAGLVQEGRLLPASEAKVVAILDVLPGEETVSFAEGEDKLSPRDAIRAVLEEQPKIVSFGRADLPEAAAEAQVAFASDGATVDPASLERHNQALAYQRQHPGADYMTAVRAVS